MKNRNPVLILLLLLFSLQAFSQIAVCSYKNRKRIVFNNLYVSGSTVLTDFPVPVQIASDNDLRVSSSGGDVQSVNGYDIIFTAADGVTLLDFERVKYVSTTGQLQCWVKLPRLSPSERTIIYMYYGNASATDQSTSSTWSNGFVGVWHFDNSLNNSTATTGLNGTNFSSTNNSAGILGESRFFVQSSSQYVDVTPYNSAYNITNELTVSSWYKPTSVTNGQRIVSNENNSTGGYMMGLLNANKMEFEIRTSSNTAVGISNVSGGSPLNGGNWYHLVGQYSNSGDFLKTYINGAIDRTLTTTASMGSSTATLKFSRDAYAASGYLDGQLDELRISNVIRSADWVLTEYNSQLYATPGAFYTISSEAVSWSGASSTSWNNNANWLGGAKPVAYNDVLLPVLSASDNQPTLDQSIQLSSLWIQQGTTLTLSNSNTLSVAYDVVNCGAISGLGSSVLSLNSTTHVASQSLGGGGRYNLINLIVNNTFSSSPTVVFNNSVNVLGYLNLVSGIVSTTSTNILFMTSGSTISTGTTTSFINGPMAKNGTTAFVFPVGKGSNWRRIGISSTGTVSTTWRAEYFNTPYTNTSTVNSPLVDVSKLEWWQLDRLNGTGSAQVSLYWQSATASGIDNCSDLTIARWNGSSWDERPATTQAGSSCSGTGAGTITTTASLTAFSPFTFGSKSATLNPLPVELIEFTSECSEKGVDIYWSTATERNSSHFILESSTDGNNWSTTTTMRAAGSSLLQKDYHYFNPERTSVLTYYRLTQVDRDDSQESFPLIASSCVITENQMSLFPNPAEDHFNMEVNLSSEISMAQFRIVDALGNIIVYREISLQKGLNKFQFTDELKPGAYSVLLNSDFISFPAQKLIIR